METPNSSQGLNMENIRSPLLSVREISKYFGGVCALDKVSLDIEEGEVVALLGDNGAGKSTLIKIISGASQADKGEIHLDGKPMFFRAPRDAMEAGIHTVFQNLSLCDNLDVAANLFLGKELHKNVLNFIPCFDHSRMRQQATSLLHDLAVDIPRVDRRVKDLSGTAASACNLKSCSGKIPSTDYGRAYRCSRGGVGKNRHRIWANALFDSLLHRISDGAAGESLGQRRSYWPCPLGRGGAVCRRSRCCSGTEG
jgi:ABC-type iron transport system FetAB ATPase subunit